MGAIATALPGRPAPRPSPTCRRVLRKRFLSTIGSEANTYGCRAADYSIDLTTIVRWGAWVGGRPLQECSLAQLRGFAVPARLIGCPPLKRSISSAGAVIHSPSMHRVSSPPLTGVHGRGGHLAWMVWCALTLGVASVRRRRARTGGPYVAESEQRSRSSVAKCVGYDVSL